MTHASARTYWKTLFICMAGSLFFLPVPGACIEKAPPKLSTLSDEIDSIYPLPDLADEPCLLAYSHSDKQLRLLCVRTGRLEKVARATTPGNVSAAAVYKGSGAPRIAVAFGMGRGDLTPPLTVYLYDSRLKNPVKIFDRLTERSQATFLGERNGKLYLGFFESKYITALGALTPAETGAWPFVEQRKIRLGMNVEVVGDQFIVGRPYGEVQGQDGDVLMFPKSGPPQPLPTYRGVSSIRTLGGNPEQPDILVGDGWHQNYGQFAQARLSLLRYHTDTARYGLENLGIVPDAWAINRIYALDDDLSRIILVTNNAVVRVSNKGAWDPIVLVKQTDPNKVFEAFPLRGKKGEDFLVVSDGKISLYKIS